MSGSETEIVGKENLPSATLVTTGPALEQGPPPWVADIKPPELRHRYIP
jgi:hypothetical protein